MKKGRRYKTQKERDNAAKFVTPKMRNFRREMVEKTTARSATRPVRLSAFYSLTFNKETKEYLLTDLKKNVCIGLYKHEVQDSEIAMGRIDQFNSTAAEFFNLNKLK